MAYVRVIEEDVATEEVAEDYRFISESYLEALWDGEWQRPVGEASPRLATGRR